MGSIGKENTDTTYFKSLAVAVDRQARLPLHVLLVCMYVPVVIFLRDGDRRRDHCMPSAMSHALDSHRYRDCGRPVFVC